MDRIAFPETGLPIKIRRTPEENRLSLRGCVSCGAPEFMSFTFVAYAGLTQTLDFCRECSLKISLFMARAWAEQTEPVSMNYQEEHDAAQHMITVADVLRLTDIHKLLYVCTHLAEYLSGESLQGSEMKQVEEALCSLLLILSTRGMKMLPSMKE